MKRGFITVAQNSGGVDYIRMAYGLALSLKATQTKYNGLSIMVDHLDDVEEKYRDAFDEIIEIPWGDDGINDVWKIHNKWKVIHTSPYDETILVDCDMLFLSDISEWWKILETKDVWACTQPLDFRGSKITDTTFRKTFVDNHIPHVYTAFLYFKKKPIAYDLFRGAEYIIRNWNDFRTTLFEEQTPKKISGDLAFGASMVLMDITLECTSNTIDYPTFTHMKTQLITTVPGNILFGNDWVNYLHHSIDDDLKLTVGGYVQSVPFHYNHKEFLTDSIIGKLEKYNAV